MFCRVSLQRRLAQQIGQKGLFPLYASKRLFHPGVFSHSKPMQKKQLMMPKQFILPFKNTNVLFSAFGVQKRGMLPNMDHLASDFTISFTSQVVKEKLAGNYQQSCFVKDNSLMSMSFSDSELPLYLSTEQKQKIRDKLVLLAQQNGEGTYEAKITMNHSQLSSIKIISSTPTQKDSSKRTQCFKPE